MTSGTRSAQTKTGANKMAKYSATIFSNSTIHNFVDFEAASLTAAKRYATRNLNYAYVGDTIGLYQIDTTGQRQLISQKAFVNGARWIDY